MVPLRLVFGPWTALPNKAWISDIVFQLQPIPADSSTPPPTPPPKESNSCRFLSSRDSIRKTIRIRLAGRGVGRGAGGSMSRRG